MFGLTKPGFDIFKNILNTINDTSKTNIVHNIERIITSSILLSGGKIKTLLSRFKKYDINEEKRWRADLWTETGKPSCYEVPGNYYGIDVNPFEIIFVKNIRNSSDVRSSKNSGISDILKKQIDNYRKWL
jgi:light-regulated signal transduction histidine kinase (bacteriophytochrome)